MAECRIDNDLLWIYDLLYVPDNLDLRRRIIHSRHDHPAAGHPGRAATFFNITQDYWWPGMRKLINRYISNCETCARIKPTRHTPYGLLKPLSVPERRWQAISMDLITGLPDSNNSNGILVVVDRLTKMSHFIPIHTTMTSEQLARVFQDKIFKHHGLPSSIVTDRGSIFNSTFTRELCRLLKIQQDLSTAFHPQTDGQTERINAILEQYLRGYCNYQQSDWTELLSMAEFAYNNTVSSTTNVTPFFANYGFHPRHDYVSCSEQEPLAPAKLHEFKDQMDKLNKHLRHEMTYAQAVYAEYANDHRQPPPVFKPGDLVWLLRKNIQTTRPCAKLDFKRLGKFRIVEKISSHAYKLDLPPTMKIHPVFHVSLLEPVATNPLPGQTQPPPPPVIVDEEQEFEVDEILDSRLRRNHLSYLVKWTGFDNPTWEPAENLEHCPALIERFHTLYPSKPCRTS